MARQARALGESRMLEQEDRPMAGVIILQYGPDGGMAMQCTCARRCMEVAAPEAPAVPADVCACPLMNRASNKLHAGNARFAQQIRSAEALSQDIVTRCSLNAIAIPS